MRTPAEIRDEYIDSLNHIRSAYGKICGQVGRGHLLSFPDIHKLSEGLFLSALTYWEALCRDLIVTDLATVSAGVLRSEIREFRTKNAPYRLAERMLNHPDHPEKFVEWSSFESVVSRANEFLGQNHRYVLTQVEKQDLAKIKKVRNAIAHKSDKAWESFSALIRGDPFNLTGAQCRGVTPGRFIYAHQWNGATVMEKSLTTLENAARTLVP
ncbi:hypothetical protein HPT27_11950 [Permianibacter sp. IMCC34836]|uniref:hypothetical protein n=1 Tax=Permianibacter fluminis TaxID=2738515 RepID=UPI001552364E|nr:hypothetical protein [Permianibacter fluminis]NQD37740.1 hypothetical protein [Permianibacter fluminis]